jgi:hypothetical protein
MQNKNPKEHCNANPKLNARAENPEFNPLRPCLLREERERERERARNVFISLAAAAIWCFFGLFSLCDVHIHWVCMRGVSCSFFAAAELLQQEFSLFFSHHQFLLFPALRKEEILACVGSSDSNFAVSKVSLGFRVAEIAGRASSQSGRWKGIRAGGGQSFVRCEGKEERRRRRRRCLCAKL